MTLNTAAGVPIDTDCLYGYFDYMVGQFFKILPMCEGKEESLPVYMRSLQVELSGCGGFINGLYDNALYVSLLSILQYLIDDPDCDVSEVKREVFKAIKICNKLKASYEARLNEEVSK